MRISDWSSDVCSSDLLTATLACDLFGDPRRPLVCSSLRPTAEMCGANREQALRYLDELEQQTAPLRRSEERRVGKECVSKCSSRLSPTNEKKKNKTNDITDSQLLITI